MKCPSCKKKAARLKKGVCPACYQLAKRQREVETAIVSPYADRKDAYADKIIPYRASPTGKAYIGLAKQPLMPNDTKIGFQGVLLQNEDRTLVQCSGCGKWMQQITLAHVRSCLGMKGTNEYRERFGLNRTQGLISDQASLKRTKTALLAQQGRHIIERKPRRSGCRKQTMQFFNKHGTCPEQLKERLFQFIRDNRELPAAGNRGRSIYEVLCRRHGKWNKALIAYGLPIFDSIGTKKLYVFPDGSKYEWSMQSGYDREALFQMIVQKCPEVRGYLTPADPVPLS